MGSSIGSRRRQGSVAAGLLAALVLVVVIVAAVLAVARLERRNVVVSSRPQATVERRPPPESVGAQASDFDGCPVEGDGGDRALNRLKNRGDARNARDASFDSVLTLPIPRAIGGGYRSRWPRQVASAVAVTERRAVRVEAYVARATLSGPESTNCHGDAAAYRDFHIWLTAAPTSDRTRSVIAEMTPRMRARHTGWDLTRLRDVSRRRERVRVAGWLLLDQEHPEQIGRTRGTIWEIHPVSSFEVFRGGRWVSLDDLPKPRGRR